MIAIGILTFHSSILFYLYLDYKFQTIQPVYVHLNAPQGSLHDNQEQMSFKESLGHLNSKSATLQYIKK